MIVDVVFVVCWLLVLVFYLLFVVLVIVCFGWCPFFLSLVDLRFVRYVFVVGWWCLLMFVVSRLLLGGRHLSVVVVRGLLVVVFDCCSPMID